MEKLSKYISFNLLSLMGYIFGVFLLMTLLIFIPIAWHKDLILNSDWASNITGLVLTTIRNTFIYLLCEILILLFAIFEFIFYKIKKIEPIVKLFDNFYKIYLIYFRIGLLLSSIPFIIICYIFTNP